MGACAVVELVFEASERTDMVFSNVFIWKITAVFVVARFEMRITQARTELCRP